MRETPVSVAGCGVVCAVGRGTEALLSALQENRTGLRPDARFRSPRFQSDIVGAAPRAKLDSDNPAHELATNALADARAAAGELLAKISPARIGLILATTKANIEALERLSAGRPCSSSAIPRLTRASGCRRSSSTERVYCVIADARSPVCAYASPRFR